MRRWARYKALLAARGRKPLAASSQKRWSETERRDFAQVLHGLGTYEGEEIRITPDDCEKHIYTPDFVIDTPCGRVYHEVKGSWRLASQDAARLRFSFAALARPRATFVWAKEERRRGLWTVEVWRDGGRKREKAVHVIGFRITEGGVEWQKKVAHNQRSPGRSRSSRRVSRAG